MKYLTHSLVLLAAGLSFYDQGAPVDRSTDIKRPAITAKPVASHRSSACGELMGEPDAGIRIFVDSQSVTDKAYAFARSTRPIRRTTAQRR